MTVIEFTSYKDRLDQDAKSFMNDFYKEFLDSVKEDGSKELNEFIDGDGKLHNFIDQYLSLREAVEIIEQCDNEETDSSIWEGLPPKEAIVSMGFWSYKNDMYIMVKEMFEEKLNEDLLSAEDDFDNISDEVDRLSAELEENKDSKEIKKQYEEAVEAFNKQQEFVDELSSTIDRI